MTTAELQRTLNLTSAPASVSIPPHFVYGTMFLDCPEEMAKTVHQKLSELFGRVELNSVGDSAFTFAVSA